MSIKQNGGVFGRNPTFNDVTIDGTLTFDGDIDINSDLKIDGDLEVTGTSKLTGNVGIGTSALAYKLAIFGTGAGNSTVQIEGEGGADPYINFLTNNATHWSMGVDDSDADTFKVSKHSALGTNDYWKVSTSGDVSVKTGNLVIGTSGKGIDFSATAGTGTSELLSDYEEGVFTATVAGDATGALSRGEGVYTKVGRLVFVEIYIVVSTNFTSNVIGGLPFTVGDLVAGTSFGQSGVALTNADGAISGAVQETTTNIKFYTNNNATSTHNLTTVNSGYRLSLCYQA